MATSAANVVLPAGVGHGHVEGLALPAGFVAHQRLGQLVDVRDQAGNRYLLGQTDGHWTLHRRVAPHAPGHARNATEVGPPLGVEKAAADE